MNITCSNLIKEYNNNPVLNISTLKLQKGDLVGILGSNGAGKSTLLNILGGIDLVFSGDVDYFKNFNPLLDCSMVFQQPYMLARTVYNNLAYPLKVRKQPKDQIHSRVQAMLERLELAHLGDRRATTLSGGEKQRLALARGQIGEPHLLLLDEPTASTDFHSSTIIEELLQENYTKGMTQIIVTHNLAQAKRVCKTLVFLHQGQVAETGKTQDLLRRPQTALFKQFIESQMI